MSETNNTPWKKRQPINTHKFETIKKLQLEGTRISKMAYMTNLSMSTVYKAITHIENCEQIVNNLE